MNKGESKLTHEILREILHYDPLTGDFTWLKRIGIRIKVGRVAGFVTKVTKKNYYRRVIGMFDEEFLAHRLAWFYVTGAWPKSGLDHENGDSLDNRFKNLREATQSQNMQNQRKAKGATQSGVLGVYKRGTRWCAKIGYDGKSHDLGTYATKELAHEAYLTEKRKRHEFCTI